MQIAKNRLEELETYLSTPQRVVILSHTNPDGDALGSSLAWAEILEKRGHKVTCILPNKYPYYLDFMPGCERVVIYKSDNEGRAAEAVKGRRSSSVSTSTQCHASMVLAI